MAESRTKKYAIEFKLYDGTTRSVSIEIPLGEDGGYYIPHVENEGENTLIRFTPSSPDMPPIDPVTILNLSEAVNLALAQAKESGEFDGRDGIDGQPGEDGYTPIKGVDYFDGKDGQPGKDGQDGSPGKDGVDGKTPVKGEDYWTYSDKQEIADEIMQAAGELLLPPVTGDDNNQILQIVNGAWVKVAVKDSSVATFIDDYISSALEGDY